MSPFESTWNAAFTPIDEYGAVAVTCHAALAVDRSTAYASQVDRQRFQDLAAVLDAPHVGSGVTKQSPNARRY